MQDSADRVWAELVQSMSAANPEIWLSFSNDAGVVQRYCELHDEFMSIYGYLSVLAVSRHKAVDLLDQFRALVVDTTMPQVGSDQEAKLQARWAKWGMDASSSLGFQPAARLLDLGLYEIIRDSSSAMHALEVFDKLRGLVSIGSVDVTTTDGMWKMLYWDPIYVRCVLAARYANLNAGALDMRSDLVDLSRQIDDLEMHRTELTALPRLTLFASAGQPLEVDGRINCRSLEEAVASLFTGGNSESDKDPAWELKRRIERIRLAQFHRELLSVEIDDPTNMFSVFYFWPPELHDSSDFRTPKQWYYREPY